MIPIWGTKILVWHSKRKKEKKKVLEDWERGIIVHGAKKALSFSCVSMAKISGTILAF